MKKQVNNRAEMEAFVEPLIAENRYVINIREVAEDGSFIIQWQEHKKYTAVDGKEFHDEVWTTAEGDIIQVQDLTLDHAHNIIRMYLRQQREARALLESLTTALSETDLDEDEEQSVSEVGTAGPTLH